MLDRCEDYEIAVAPKREVLTFRVERTRFALPLDCLREVVELVEILRVEGGDSLTEGLVNYRGSAIPVVDMRKALRFPPCRYGIYANIIITDVEGGKTGLIVDEVLDVLAIPETAIEPPGTGAAPWRAVSGIAKLQDCLLPILDISLIVSREGIEQGGDQGGQQTAESEEPESEEARRILRERAMVLGRPILHREAEQQERVTIVRFTLGEGQYALETDFVREIVLPQAITPIPCAPQYLMGAINIRGAVMPVLDLAGLLKVEQRAQTTGEEARIVIIEAEGETVGLWVSAVLGISGVRPTDISPPLSTIADETLRLIKGEFDHEERIACMIEAREIIRAIDEGSVGP